MKEIKRLKGINDILPGEAVAWQFIEDNARTIFEHYGYEQIRLPLIEYLDLFTRSIGETADIVQKEMYRFTDRAGRVIALRPEATAGVVRAYIENDLKREGLKKLYYSGAMFRGENPQAGRYRQFHQIGVEAIGSSSPYLDCEIIVMLDNFLQKNTLTNYEIILNNVGCLQDREKFSKHLKQILNPQIDLLCIDCRVRLTKNPLRIFDCKNAPCKKLLQNLPKISENICPDCAAHFTTVTKLLTDLNIRYIIDHNLVRGLDYYTKTVFEITHKELSAQNAICAGGRYDNLIAELGGTATGACGFALGVERLIIALKNTGFGKLTYNYPKVYIATLGDQTVNEGFNIWHALHQETISTTINYEGKSLKAKLRLANKQNALLVIILGENEMSAGTVMVKDMHTKSQDVVARENLVSYIKDRLNIPPICRSTGG
ncbi:MAG: histidine--tRNA ligase [Candidatus Omnitrophota bacterium]